MADTVHTERKNALRREKRLLRKSLSANERALLDAAIRDRIEALQEYASSTVVAAYATDGSEPDLLPLLKKAALAGKTVCLPRYRTDSDYEMAVMDPAFTLVPGKWNIPEPERSALPAAPTQLKQALWLVPGVAFDETCARLGRGKGIYDRMLACIQGPSAGVFYECQKTPAVPVEKHDRLLDLIVTERNTYRASAKINVKQQLSSEKSQENS